MPTNTKNVTNEAALVNDQKMQSGIAKYFTGTLKTLSPKGTATTPAKLDAIFQDDIDQTQALDTLLGQVAEQRAKQRAARALAIQTRSDVKAYIIGNYGDEVSTMMNDFGYGTPKKKSTPSAATKAQAVVQAKATREARGTVGPKKKAKVKGVVATPAAEAAPVAAGSPAAPAVTTPAVTK
jgi:hypothetical protein